jgi:hypothetical protein
MMNLRPLKVIYQLVVGEYDEDGNLVGEHPQPPATLYAPQFGELEQRVAATMATAPIERSDAPAGAPGEPGL